MATRNAKARMLQHLDAATVRFMSRLFPNWDDEHWGGWDQVQRAIRNLAYSAFLLYHRHWYGEGFRAGDIRDWSWPFDELDQRREPFTEKSEREEPWTVLLRRAYVLWRVHYETGEGVAALMDEARDGGPTAAAVLRDKLIELGSIDPVPYDGYAKTIGDLLDFIALNSRPGLGDLTAVPVVKGAIEIRARAQKHGMFGTPPPSITRKNLYEWRCKPCGYVFFIGSPFSPESTATLARCCPHCGSKRVEFQEGVVHDNPY